MRLLYIFIFILFAMQAYPQQEQRAKEILDEVSEKTRSFETIAAEFTYSMENEEEDILDSYNGIIELKGRMYKLDLPDLGTQNYSDGKTIWSYMEDAGQVTISSVEEDPEELLDPSTLFTIYENGFNYRFAGEENKSGINLYVIELIPEDEDQDFTNILLSVNKSNMMIHSAVINDGTGTHYSININKLETNKNMDDSYFRFDQSEFPDLEVIDFR